MGEIGRRVKVPDIADVIYLNNILIKKMGGFYKPPFNLLNPSGLIWALERITSGKIFGIDQYPTLADKAALLAWTIINDHVFNDGCKRTGFATAMTFLSLNDHLINLLDHEIYETAKRIAKYYEEPKFSFQELAAWFQDRIDKEYPRTG